MPEYQRFSEFADPRDGFPLEGRKRKLNEILNIEMLIINYRISPSKVNADSCLTIQFEIDGEKQVVFTGSKVLTNQMERYKDKIPFLAKIIKQNKYYTLN